MTGQSETRIAPKLPPALPVDALLSIREVEALVALKKSAIYMRVKSGEFPSPFRIFNKKVAWRSSEVQAFLDSLVRVDERRSGAHL